MQKLSLLDQHHFLKLRRYHRRWYFLLFKCQLCCVLIYTQLPAKLPTLHDEKRAEELLISNAAMKKRQLELEEEVCASTPMAHLTPAESACQVSKLKQELQNKESNLKSQIAVLSERLQQVLPAALLQSIYDAANNVGAERSCTCCSCTSCQRRA